MYNQNDFRGTQADRNAQIRHAEQQQIAHEAHSEARIGPVFGPLLARVGEGLVAAGTRLQQRYADLQAEANAPLAGPRSLAHQD